MRHNWPFLTATLFLLGNLGCSPQTKSATTPPVSSAPAISLIKPQRHPIKRTVEQPGTIQAYEETILYPKIAGYVKFIAPDPRLAKNAKQQPLIDIGSKVSKDEILAELNVPELDDELKQKEAVVKQWEAETAQSHKALLASEAAVAAAQSKVAEIQAGLSRAQALFDRWHSEMDRVNRLVASGVIDTQTRDETLNQFKSAEAGKVEADAKVNSALAAVTKAKADQDKAVVDIVAAEAKAEVARADVRRVRTLREYTHIRSPYAGVITRRAVSTGDFLTADGKHSLFTIARIDPVRIVFRVPEVDSGLVEVGQTVQVALPASVGKSLSATVARTSWSLEPGSRTLRVEADYPNPDGLVRPGMYVYAKLIAELPPAWALPAAAIAKMNDEPIAYLHENDKLHRVGLQLTVGDAQYTQIKAYRRDASAWLPITGNESFATPAAQLSDGQVVVVK